MEKTIEFYSYDKNIIIYKYKKYFYDLHSGRIEECCRIEDLLNDENLFKEMITSGFGYYQKEYWGYEKRFFPNGNYILDSRCKNFYIPISKNFIEFYSLNWAKEECSNQDYIILSNNNLSNNVDSFYEFDLLVELEGIENKRFGKVGDFGIEFCIPASDFSHPNLLDDEQLKNKMVELFGEPQVHPLNENDKYGRFSKEYFIPKSKINKIIGIKKYRDTSTIGQPDGEQFTGEQEEIILDLHNFDENIYKIFEEHKMLEIKNLE